MRLFGVFERLDPRIQVMEGQFDPREAAQHLIDLPEQVLVFHPRDVDGAARQAALRDPAFHSVLAPVHVFVKKQEPCQVTRSRPPALATDVVAAVGCVAVNR